MADDKTKVITLICERAADLKQHTDASGALKDVPGVHVVRYPCSGMIQPLMIEAAMKAGASGVIVCGCQLGDCYYREGNKMIRERLLGDRPPGLKKTVDRRRVIALWLQRYQTQRFISEAREFVTFLAKLNSEEGAPKAEPPKPAAKPAAEKAKVEPEKTPAPSKPEAAQPEPEKKPEPETSSGEAKANKAENKQDDSATSSQEEASTKP